MKRYLTIENQTGEIEAFTAADDYRAAVNRAVEWVWQFAESKEQAIAQHVAKHDEWGKDQENGTEKETY